MSIRHSISPCTFALCALLVGGLAACDSGSDGGERSLAISGTVTDNAGFAKTAGNIQGAVVTASAVGTNGSLAALDGEATTDASGRYTLDVATSASSVILRAAKAGFESKVIVEAGGSSSSAVSAAPMNSETRAEADVFVEGRAHSASETFAAADVALFVDSQLAAAINSGATTAADVATAIAAGNGAERSYAERDPDGYDDDESRRRVEENRRDSFIEFQSQLSAATTTSAQAIARDRFERAFVSAFAEAGIDVAVQARAAHARKSAMMAAAVDAEISSEARFALARRAEASLALATSAAIQAILESNGAAQARIDAVAAAGETYSTAVASATAEAQLAAAYGSFSASVEAELSVVIGVNSTVMATARTATDAAKVTLQTAIDAAVDATDIASAYVAFFAAAEAGAEASLSSSTNATMGAKVLALIALY